MRQDVATVVPTTKGRPLVTGTHMCWRGPTPKRRDQTGEDARWRLAKSSALGGRERAHLAFGGTLLALARMASAPGGAAQATAAASLAARRLVSQGTQYRSIPAGGLTITVSITPQPLQVVR